MKRPNFLKPSTWLQLQFALGMLLTTPFWLLVYRHPMFRDWPLWVMLGVPFVGYAMALLWFRQCMSPDGTSVKPKWW